MSVLLQPVALMACVLGLWRLAADLSLAREFAISSGLFSHWQVWMALGVGVLATSALLRRYGQDGGNGPLGVGTRTF